MSLTFDSVSVRLADHGSSPASASGAALRDIDLSIGAGAQVAVVGPSGAGKTTLLMTAACALRPGQGRVLIGGDDPWQLAQRQRHRLRGRLFLAPQIAPLPPRQRVVTAVLAGRLPAMGFWRSLRSLFYPVDIAAAYSALEPFELAGRLFDRVDRLSGGERQRVSLARALVSPARLWLLDEPLSGLDPVRAAQAVRILRELAAQRAITLVVSMHQVELALEHFPRLIGLREGSVVFDRPAADVSRETLQQLYGPAGPGEADGPAPAASVEPPAVALHFR